MINLAILDDQANCLFALLNASCLQQFEKTGWHIPESAVKVLEGRLEQHSCSANQEDPAFVPTRYCSTPVIQWRLEYSSQLQLGEVVGELPALPRLRPLRRTRLGIYGLFAIIK